MRQSRISTSKKYKPAETPCQTSKQFLNHANPSRVVPSYTPGVNTFSADSGLIGGTLERARPKRTHQTRSHQRTMPTICRATFKIILGLALATTPCLAGEVPDTATPTPAAPSITEPPAFPLHESTHYIVKYLGVTCGHLSLSSSVEDLEGRPTYHIVMTAKNSKFFNRIYSVDVRIDSWVDAETLSTVLYESVKTENGESLVERHEIDWKKGTLLSVENGETTSLDFTSDQPVLDPLAFVYRLHALATNHQDKLVLTLLTLKGPVETVATVRGPEKKRTSRGRRMLLEIKPLPTDGTMFSKKGKFSLWVDPDESGPLYILDFRLSFGHLTAKIN